MIAPSLLYCLDLFKDVDSQRTQIIVKEKTTLRAERSEIFSLFFLISLFSKHLSTSSAAVGKYVDVSGGHERGPDVLGRCVDACPNTTEVAQAEPPGAKSGNIEFGEQCK